MQTAVSVSARSLFECLDTLPYLSHQTSPNSTNKLPLVLLITTIEAGLGDNTHSPPPAPALPGDRWVWCWPLIVTEGSGGVEKAKGSFTATSPVLVRVMEVSMTAQQYDCCIHATSPKKPHISLYGGSIRKRSCEDSPRKIILQDYKLEHKQGWRCGYYH